MVPVAVCVAVAVDVAVKPTVDVDVTVPVCVMVGVGGGGTQFEASQNDPAKNSWPPVQLACGTCEHPPSGLSQQSP